MDKCRICSSTNYKDIRKVKSPYFDAFYTLYECDDCKCRFFDARENEDISLTSLYESFADKNNQMLNSKFTPNSYWKNQVDIINKYSKNEISNVLDIGCRTGDFLMHFDDKVEKHGVELSEQYSKICVERGLITYTDFIEKINFDTKFDVVSAYALLEHLEFPGVVLKSMKNIVADDGLIVILVPWYQCLKEKLLNKIGVQWHMFTPPEHLNYYSREYLISYFTEDGTYELVKQNITSGGLINPFRKIPVLKQGFSVFMKLVDMSFVNRLAIFDHLFLYFRKVK